MRPQQIVVSNQKNLTMLGTIIWPGSSGRQYWYAIYPRHWRFDPGQPGNYVYAIESAPSRLTPLYIGETDDLNRQLLNHDSDFNLFVATHLCVHVNYYYYGASGRFLEQRDLIKLWRPACNGARQPSESRENVICTVSSAVEQVTLNGRTLTEENALIPNTLPISFTN